jgi:hypothetical protein
MELKTTVVNPNPASPRGAGFAGRDSLPFAMLCFSSSGSSHDLGMSRGVHSRMIPKGDESVNGHAPTEAQIIGA